MQLKVWRIRKGWTQRQLADKLGVRRRNTVTEWESMSRVPDHVAAKVADLKGRKE